MYRQSVNTIVYQIQLYKHTFTAILDKSNSMHIPVLPLSVFF